MTRSSKRSARVSVLGGHRRGFILVFGTRSRITPGAEPAVEMLCPSCHNRASLKPMEYRQWFTLFFLPVFPISGKTLFTECCRCHAQFRMGVREIQRRVDLDRGSQYQQAIGLYNSLVASPKNAVTLHQLLMCYGGLENYAEAIAAAQKFPEALEASEQCLTTLGRIYLAAKNYPEAVRTFDRAIAKNPSWGEAHHYKAVTLISLSDREAAMAAAIEASGHGYAPASELLRQIQAGA